MRHYHCLQHETRPRDLAEAAAHGHALPALPRRAVQLWRAAVGDGEPPAGVAGAAGISGRLPGQPLGFENGGFESKALIAGFSIAALLCIAPGCRFKFGATSQRSAVQCNAQLSSWPLGNCDACADRPAAQVGMLGRRLGPLPPGMPPAYQVRCGPETACAVPVAVAICSSLVSRAERARTAPCVQALVAVCLDPDSAKRPGFGEIGAALEAMLSAEALADGTAA